MFHEFDQFARVKECVKFRYNKPCIYCGKKFTTLSRNKKRCERCDKYGYKTEKADIE